MRTNLTLCTPIQVRFSWYAFVRKPTTYFVTTLTGYTIAVLRRFKHRGLARQNPMNTCFQSDSLFRRAIERLNLSPQMCIVPKCWRLFRTKLLIWEWLVTLADFTVYCQRNERFHQNGKKLSPNLHVLGNRYMEDNGTLTTRSESVHFTQNNASFTSMKRQNEKQMGYL